MLIRVCHHQVMAEDEGYGPDLEKDEVVEDVGMDGGAASAEEGIRVEAAGWA
jgi:hypothetical protein